MPRKIIWIYATASAVNVLSQIIHSEMLNIFTKPLLMPLLLFYVYQKSKGNITPKVLFLLGAIVFSWFGDIVLIYRTDQIFFISGIGFFLVAQIIYIITLRKAVFQKPAWRLTDAYPYIAVIYGGILFYILLPAGNLTVPILLYGIIILAMTVSASLRKEVTYIESYGFALFGSVLFVISDSILAINAFRFPIEYSGVFVMSTYCAAQYFLAEGILKHKENGVSQRI